MVDDIKQGGEEQLHDIPKPKSPLAAREEEILAFWQREKIFEKSLAKPAPKGEYIFYDGPPFATGLPHFGHLLQSAVKDAIPRYRTMQGYRVARRWGWDCHGLPLENQIEQELGIKTKRGIEELGIEKFNKAAREAVLRYAGDWEKIIPRFGRWVDMQNGYKTMDAEYTQSVWWAFKNLYDRGLIYEGFKSMHLCPRCGTTLSNFEVAQGYKDIDDIAVTVKLRLVDEPGTSLLIWTTTPWTLPGNAAAAVNADATYVKVKAGDEFFIVAKERLDFLGAETKLPNENSLAGRAGPRGLFQGEVLSEFSGKDLVGKKYEPPFDYFKNELHKHKTHAFKVYAADFVTMQEGTGIVHLAPAFGSDDLALAQKEKIPLIQHVTDEGKFVATVKDFAGLPVKPKGNPKETDAKIAGYLKSHSLLFKEEKIKHSYPHCWRCDTPLLNWAANSWFVNVQKLKSKLLSENAKVAWVPGHVGRSRFQNLLEGAPDWAISRSRFWGAPLPVWRHSKTKEIKVAGSVEELLSMVRKSGNKYFVMRHGEAKSNVQNIDDIDGDSENHLTEKGRDMLRRTVASLKSKSVDTLIISPLLRTRETAVVLQKELELPDSSVMIDERLHEARSSSLDEVRRKIGEFLFEIERRYTGKNILIISHGFPLWVLQQVAAQRSTDTFSRTDMLGLAQVEELPFVLYPRNENYELDLHRPYIDEVPMGDALAGEWERVSGVFDCWFESGSVPFASNSYPAHKKQFNPEYFFGLFPKGYPAQFIAESIDQTRGWFYSLIVLSVGLFGRSPYQTVVTNGLVLAEDGRKMSKKLKNYPDPMELVEQFGADALRAYLLSSSVIRGEDLRFSARGVEEVSKKLLMRLDNVRSFYELYAPQNSSSAQTLAPHILDRWILSRLGQLVEEVTAGFEKYELDSATRPLSGFVDDLSTWYLRRSRDRFKINDDPDATDGAGKTQALATLRLVLKTVAHLMAPIMPFYAEYLYRQMKDENDAESVHLRDWPEAMPVDKEVLSSMSLARKVSSQALELRERAGIKIRQPLSKLDIGWVLPKEIATIIAEEVNVKQVVMHTDMYESVQLDTTITPELKEEGMVRNVIRTIQAQRKEDNLTITHRPSSVLGVFSSEEKQFLERNKEKIIASTNLSNLEIKVDDSVKVNEEVKVAIIK